MRKLFVALLICGCSSSENVIGPAGGTIVIEDGPTFEFPAGAVAQELEVIIERTELPQSAPFMVLSEAWKCEPDGTDFDVPVAIRMPYVPDGLPAAPTLYWSIGGGDFNPVEDGQVAGGVATGTIRHFSVGFVGRPAS